MRRAFALVFGLPMACLSPTGGLPLEGSETGVGLSAGSTSVVATSSSSTSVASSASSSGAVTTGNTDASEGSGRDTDSFVVTPDGGGVVKDECDIGKQDCPAGQKCTWASVAESGWFDVTVCVPLARDPLPPGAVCTYDLRNAFDGVDECAATAICLDLDDWDGTGICTQMCEWNVIECPEDMVCIGSRTLNVCEPACDLLAQDCPEGERCDIEFLAPLCEQDWPEEHPQHGVGAACEYASQCEIGATCIPQATIECEFNCCTPFCERGKAGCPLPGQGCIEPYEGWDDETGWDEVGVCRVVNP